MTGRFSDAVIVAVKPKAYEGTVMYLRIKPLVSGEKKTLEAKDRIR